MLEANHLAFSFKRDVPVLKDVSLAIEPGTFTAILGKNGCGKSTLLSLLTAMRQPAAGEVLLDGQPLHSLDRQSRARKVALVEQHTHGNRLTVFDSVLLGRKPFMDSAPSAEDRQIVAKVLNEMGLADYALRYMDELSGGEYQAVVLARAFAQQTETLLLDEPTNNLDPANQQQAMQFVRRAVDDKNVAAAAVMHDINLALRYCDKFLFLRDGEVDAYGDISIVNSDEIYRIYDIEADVIDHGGRKVAIPK